MFLADAITAVSAKFDTSSTATSDTVIRSWINQAVRKAVATAQWRKVRRELGTTVVGTSSYEIDEDIVAIKSLRVASSLPYVRVGSTEMYELQAGVRWLKRGTPGAFCPEFEALAEGAAEATADGDTSMVEIFPTPTTAGQAITALCAVQSLTIDASIGSPGTYVIGLPNDLAWEIAVDGASAIGYEDAMGRPDLAAAPRARAEVATQELERRANSRVGQGPISVPIVRP